MKVLHKELAPLLKGIVDNDNNYRIIPRNKLISPLIRYYSGKKIISSSLTKILYNNMNKFNIFTKSVSDFSYPRNNKIFDLSRPYKAKVIEDVNNELVDIFRQFIKEIICSDDEDMFNYIRQRVNQSKIF